MLLYGFEKSGKSTLINSYQNGQFTMGDPSTAHKITELPFDSEFSFSIIEVGGRKEVRNYVSQYISYVHANIFVIDANAKKHYDEIKNELFSIINHPESLGKPLAVIFSKQDIAYIQPAIIIDELKLLNRYNHPHQVFTLSAKYPQEFSNVLAWFKQCFTENKFISQNKASRILKRSLLDILSENKEGLPLLAILGQLDYISQAIRIKYNKDQVAGELHELSNSGDVIFHINSNHWKITEKGQERIESNELFESTKFERLREVIEGREDEDEDETKKKEVLDEFELDELAEIFSQKK